MSREVTGISPPLSSELLSAQLYKPTQGRLTRQVTCGSIWAAIAIGSWRLWVTLTGKFSPEYAWVQIAAPLVVLLIGGWIGFRLVNWPRFADFLISVEAELKKVSWPTRGELIRASGVVICTIVFLSLLLFGVDIFWDAVGRLLRIVFR
jgi:preprotein translocase subunit SecE